MAFAIGSALGGVAGALYAPLTQYIDPVPFNLSLSLDLLMMVIVGGAGFFFGPFLGAMIAVLLPEWLRFTQGYYLMLYAIAVILLLIYSPSGHSRHPRSPSERTTYQDRVCAAGSRRKRSWIQRHDRCPRSR